MTGSNWIPDRQWWRSEAFGGDTFPLAYIGGEIKYINETKALIIEYLKDKREMLDKVPDWTAESLRLQQIIHGEQEELKKRLADVNRNIFKIDAELKELKEATGKRWRTGRNIIALPCWTGLPLGNPSSLP